MGFKPRTRGDRLGAPALESREIVHDGERSTVRALCDRLTRAAPPVEVLREATRLVEVESPSGLEATAQWLVIDEALSRAGLSDEEIARVYVSATERGPAGRAPAGVVVWRAFERWPDAGFAREICAVVADGTAAFSALPEVATVALAVRARAGEALGPMDEELINVRAPWQALRQVVAALPPERRGAVVVRLVGQPRSPAHASALLGQILPVLDLVEGPEIEACLDRLIAELPSDERASDRVARARAGGGPQSEPTRMVTESLDYLLFKRRAATRADSVGEVTHRIHARGFVELTDATRLTNASSWRFIPDQRRAELGERLAAALGSGFRFRGLEDFGGGAVPLLDHAGLGLELALVHGDRVEHGFSPEEEALARAAADAARDSPSWNEEFGQLLEALPTMRPLRTIYVGPLLVSRRPLDSMPPSELPGWLEAAAPFRLPSEAEWERVARGGVSRALTWRGHTVPDEAWFRETAAGGKALANRFGCWGFGLLPEFCADAWHPSYDGAPDGAEPWWGPGSRVARGGAELIFPWQDCGEWHLLCNAVRQPASGWEFEISTRPVIGIRCR